jgi:ribosome-binding protein aMBF1 (putative translation factor)
MEQGHHAGPRVRSQKLEVEPMFRLFENFPKQVNEVRRQQLSQEKLAHALGVAPVNRWENGKTVPSKPAQLSFENFFEKMTEHGKLKHDQV